MMKRSIVTVCLIGFLLAMALPVVAADYDFGGDKVTYVAWWNIFADIEDRVALAEETFNVDIQMLGSIPGSRTIPRRLSLGF